MRTEREINNWLVHYVAKLAAVDPAEIDTALPFNSYGIDSTATAGLGGDLALWLGVRLHDSVAFDHPTIEQLSNYVSEHLQQQR